MRNIDKGSYGELLIYSSILARLRTLTFVAQGVSNFPNVVLQTVLVHLIKPSYIHI